MDDLIAGVDAPQLRKLTITFFNQILFDSPQFIQFINRTPTFKALAKAHVIFSQQNGHAEIYLSSRILSVHAELRVRILCGEFDGQVSSIEQVCTACLPPLSTLEDLYIYKAPYDVPYLLQEARRGLGRVPPDWKDNTDNTLWLELLHPFNAVKNLYLSWELARRIAPALQQLTGDRHTEVLPSLKNIFSGRRSSRESSPNFPGLRNTFWNQWGPSGGFVDSIEEGIRRFVALRQVTGHPIACLFWENAN